jgi:uncharacterized iron-regulated membrane protein
MVEHFSRSNRSRVNVDATPAISIWVLMLIVALAALGSAWSVFEPRSRQWSTDAAFQARREKAILVGLQYLQSITCGESDECGDSASAKDAIVSEVRSWCFQGDHVPLDELAKGFEARALRRGDFSPEIAEFRAHAAKEGALAIAYRRSARYPWLGAPRINLGIP